MRQASFVDVQLPTIVGIHDYEQFYADIFRKCFLHFHKHDWLRDLFTQRWNSLSLEDDDYRVALSAFQSGASHSGEVFVDKRFAQDEFDAAAARLGLAEKTTLAVQNCGSQVVQAEIQRLLSATDPDTVQEQARVNHDYFVNPLLLAKTRRTKRSLKSRIKRMIGKLSRPPRSE